jgi:DNA polymerase-3 subunit delta'
MSTTIYTWHQDAWQQLQQLRQRLPHAILFHGTEGIGKSLFAERFAQSLLCQQPLADGHACDQCDACGWFVQSNHPDYRRVRPEALEEDGAEGGEGGDGGSAAKESDGKKSKTTKAPSKEIKIDQIRALSSFMNISTHRHGMRVVVLYPAEGLNAMASNALLKTLEEPPPNTVFLLVSNSVDRLLPTILSRCRKFALPMPTFDQALAWLQGQNVSDAENWLAEQGGAPLAALALAEVGNRDEIDLFLQQLAAPSIEGALRTADKLQKTPLSQLVAWLQRWLYDIFSYKLAGKIRYYPRYRNELARLANRAEAGQLLQALKVMNERCKVADHPLSAKLFIEDMLLDYVALCS